MITTIKTQDGSSISFSDKVGESNNFVQHSDILKALSKCTFDTILELQKWMLRIKDAKVPISRQNTLRQMCYEQQGN